tara:strand:- start:871 stop:1068 length:198 start_codon:yes stop_codon:yes gene_type:complete
MSDDPDGYYKFSIVYQHTLPPWYIQTEEILAKNSKEAEQKWRDKHDHTLHEHYLLSITINTAQKQ